MKNFKCSVCGAEYDNIPFEGCTGPGCGNNNPALFEYIGDKTNSTEPINDNKDADTYNRANLFASSENLSDLRKSVELFSSIPSYGDASQRAVECENKIKNLEEKDNIYNKAVLCASSDNMSDLRQAVNLFSSISPYRDTSNKIFECESKIKNLEDEERMRSNIAQSTSFQNSFDPKDSQGISSDNSRNNLYDPNGQRENHIEITDADTGNDSESIFSRAMVLYDQGTMSSVMEAKQLFMSVSTHKDSRKMIKKCDKSWQKIAKALYRQAKYCYSQKDYVQAKELFESIRGFNNSEKMIRKCEKKLRPKKKGLLIFLIILIVVILGAGTFFALKVFVFDSNNKPKPTDDSKTRSSQTETNEAKSSNKSSNVNIEAKLEFFQKTGNNSNFNSVSSLSLDASDTTVILTVTDSESKNALKKMDCPVLKIQNGSRETVTKKINWISDSDVSKDWEIIVFSTSNVARDLGDSGTVEAVLCDPDGNEITDRVSADIEAEEKTTEKSSDKKYKNVKEYFKKENLSQDTTQSGVRTQIYASADNVLLYKYTLTNQVNKKEAITNLKKTEKEIEKSCIDTMNKILKPNIEKDQWDNLEIYHNYVNKDGSVIRIYHYTIKDGFEVVV